MMKGATIDRSIFQIVAKRDLVRLYGRGIVGGKR